MKPVWSVEFASREFAPVLPEVCQVNPGVYGFELAFWLAEALASRGIVTSYPGAEDWGWYLGFEEDNARLLIGCGGSIETWTIFVAPSPKWFGKHPSDVAVQRLASAILAALSEKGIRPLAA